MSGQGKAICGKPVGEGLCRLLPRHVGGCYGASRYQRLLRLATAPYDVGADRVLDLTLIMEGHVNGYGMNLDGWCYLPFRRLEHLGPEAAFAAAVSRLLTGEGAAQ